MNEKPRRENSEGEKFSGFMHPLIRNRSISLKTTKCSGCERRLEGDTYQFKAGKDAALANIWYLGKVNPSKEDDRICEICAQLGGEKDDKKVDNSYRSKEADEKIEIERRSVTPELLRLSPI